MLALQVTLIPSSQMAYTYPYARGHLLYRRSRVELLKPDYEVRSIAVSRMCSRQSAQRQSAKQSAPPNASTCAHIKSCCSSSCASWEHVACNACLLLCCGFRV